jgi:hypothetical protein
MTNQLIQNISNEKLYRIINTCQKLMKLKNIYLKEEFKVESEGLEEGD